MLSPPKWYEYAPQFLSRERIDGGLEFWQANEATLARAQSEFGVPAEMIVAIIGVETFYGRNTGSYRVFDALTTLAFDYPRRANFSANELKQFLLLARDQGISPLVPKGSYAGAIGPAAVHAGQRSRPMPSTTTAMAGSTCRPNRPMRSAASPTIWRGTIGSRAHRC